jgi:hypothetical protein
MNGFACAEPRKLAPRRVTVATDNPTTRLADILAFSQNIRLSCTPVLTAYARNHALASVAASLADVHLCPWLALLESGGRPTMSVYQRQTGSDWRAVKRGAFDPRQTSRDVGSCDALGDTADVTESSVLSCECTDQAEFCSAFAFLATLRRLEPGPPSHSDRPRAMATVGTGSRHAGGRAKKGRCAMSNSDWIRAASQCWPFHPNRHRGRAIRPSLC